MQIPEKTINGYLHKTNSYSQHDKLIMSTANENRMTEVAEKLTKKFIVDELY